MPLTTNEIWFLSLLGVGFSGIFIFICFTFYLKSHWLPLVEDILDGQRFYSLNIFFAGLGVLQYATIFLSKLHAKRYGMLEKREQVPKKVQRLFIAGFCLFIISGLLMFGASIFFEEVK
ncbi:hypothetical protein SG35_025885 [Thalassomonas actiniarum]|uniref:Uncharacterized protein n=1 Tax=Thalassomonas actiniarum TaxID=485447 RepID=A0AAE9YQX1_9GAMM|nr:hypothetical protein SG35_025885 [Thalassomonas actiniarum]